MIHRLACYIGVESLWEPVWVIQRQDVLLRDSNSDLLTFATVRDAVSWAKENNHRYHMQGLELPAGVLYGQERIR